MYKNTAIDYDYIEIDEPDGVTEHGKKKIPDLKTARS
jgi:hypothetical protein